MSSMSYGDIGPAVAAWATVRMLKRAVPYLHFEKFGQTYPLPTNSTNTAKFRRYFMSGATGSAGLTGSPISNFNTPLATTPLIEGVTPSGNKLSVEDYTITLAQYGDWVPITDVIQDMHPDPILAQISDILGEQAAQTIETLRFNVLKAGVNVFYANKVAGRTLLASAITLTDQRRVTTALNRQNAKKITQVVSSSPDYNTKSVEASYMAICHPDLETDIRSMTGFKAVADYGPHTTPFEGEIGSVEQVRYLTSTVCVPWADAATGTAVGVFRSTANVAPDVYPVIVLARDAYGIVPLKGKSSMTPMVVNPKPVSGDPLGQRGSVGWKLYTGTIILQEAFMARLEVLCTA
jgi:N4-gp56 family major capsid protein